MATRDDVRRRNQLANKPGIDPDLRWWIGQVNLYCKRGAATTQGLPTTTTTSTTSSTTSTTTTTTAPP